MLGLKKGKKISKELQAKREALIARADEMRKLTLNPDSGWAEYIGLLDDYVNACVKRKAVTSLDRATDSEIENLKKLDHEVWFINNFIKVIPQKIFANEEAMLKTAQQEENLEGEE